MRVSAVKLLSSVLCCMLLLSCASKVDPSTIPGNSSSPSNSPTVEDGSSSEKSSKKNATSSESTPEAQEASESPSVEPTETPTASPSPDPTPSTTVNSTPSPVAPVDTVVPSAPTVIGITPTSGLRPTWSWVTGGDGNGNYRFKLDNSDLTTGSTPTTATSFTPASDLSVGIHTLYVQESDASGHWSLADSLAITIDLATAGTPVVSGTSPNSSRTPTWTWTPSGGGNGQFRYKLDNSELSAGATLTNSTSFTPSSNISEATHTLYVQEQNSLGSWSAPGSLAITINTNPFTIPNSLKLLKGAAYFVVSWTAGGGQSQFIVVRKASSAVTWTPTNGQTYNLNDVPTAGETVVYAGSGTSFTSAATAGTDYHFAVFAADASHNYTAALTGHAIAAAADSWTGISNVNAPSARDSSVWVWTGSKMIVWGGLTDFIDSSKVTNTGGMYDPATDSWTTMSTVNAPSPRQLATAVWTGSVMIVFGGNDAAEAVVGTGGIFNPATNTWSALSTTNAPSPRSGHAAVWTGTDMLIWGGATQSLSFTSTVTNTGAMYNLQTGLWTATSITGATPVARTVFQAAWTGSEMFLWGGHTGNTYLNTGARFDPLNNSWTAMTTTGAPAATTLWISSAGVWTGSDFIVWGGRAASNNVNTGGIYNSTLGTWTATTMTSAPAGRREHCQLWTGSEYIVWGGSSLTFTFWKSGGRLNPATNISWTPLSTTNAPLGTNSGACIWTGHSMIVWTGYDATMETQHGGVYYP